MVDNKVERWVGTARFAVVPALQGYCKLVVERRIGDKRVVQRNCTVAIEAAAGIGPRSSAVGIVDIVDIYPVVVAGTKLEIDC